MRVDVNAVEPTSHDEALHDAHMFGAQLGPAKVPVFATHRNGPQRALEMVGIHRYVRIGEKYLQPQPAFSHVVEGFGKQCGRPQSMSLQMPIDPGEEGLDMRFTMGKTMKLFDLSRQCSCSNVVLDLIEGRNAPECLEHRLGLFCLRRDELAAGVAPTQSMCDTNLLGIARIGRVPIG